MSKKTKIPLGEVVAERALQFTASDGRQSEVVVRIGAPIREPAEKQDWCCPYEIRGPEKRKLMAMYGVDSMQALVHTVRIISFELEAWARREEGEFRWLEGEDLGFPLGPDESEAPGTA